MALSGSYDWSVNRDEVVRLALKKCGLIRVGEEVSAEAHEDAVTALNALLKSWQNRQIGMWLNRECMLWLDLSSQYYDLGPSGDHCTTTPHKTEVLTAASSGAGTIDVDSIANITTGDAIGIELDDGTLQWTTVNGVPAGSTVTLTAVLTDDVAVDNNVYNYTSLIQRPLDILEARVRDDDDRDIPLEIFARNQYMAIPTKGTGSQPTAIYFDPQLTNARLYVWPIGDAVNDRVMFTAKFPIQDVDTYNDDFDFPPEWLQSLAYNLAVEIAYDHPRVVPPDLLGRLQAKAASELQNAMDWDVEHASVFFSSRDRER
jgi:hypothetical protein